MTNEDGWRGTTITRAMTAVTVPSDARWSVRDDGDVMTDSGE